MSSLLMFPSRQWQALHKKSKVPYDPVKHSSVLAGPAQRSIYESNILARLPGAAAQAQHAEAYSSEAHKDSAPPGCISKGSVHSSA